MNARIPFALALCFLPWIASAQQVVEDVPVAQIAPPAPVPTPAPVQAQAPTRKPIVAVNNLNANGISASEAAALEDNLTAKLQQTGKVRVMERSQMDKILKEQSFQQSGSCDGGECAVEMGRILGIDRMVVGSVGLVGSTYTFNLRLVDIATGEALRTSALTRRGSIDDVLTDLLPKAVEELTREEASVATIVPPPPAPVQPVEPEPQPAVEQPSRGSVWPWILGGAVVVGGGVAAAILLMDSDGGGSDEQPAATKTTVRAEW